MEKMENLSEASRGYEKQIRGMISVVVLIPKNGQG